MIFAWRFLSESREVHAAHHEKKPSASRKALAYVITHAKEPGPRLIWIYAIAMGAFSGMSAILALFLMDRWGITERRIWILLHLHRDNLGHYARRSTRVGCRQVWGSAAFTHRSCFVVDGVDRVSICPNYVLLALVIACIPVGTAFTFPCVTSLLSRVIPSHERGLYMGVQQAYGGMARVIIPLWAGFSYDHFGKTVPFLTSAALVIGTIFLNLGIDDGRKSRRLLKS
jgi:nitrate/nitrite transporter NarK